MSKSCEATVRVMKYDRSPYREWHGRIARRDGSLIVIEAEFEDDVVHKFFGEIRRGTRTVEYYWTDRWYNVFRFLDSDGSTRLWYCNVSSPPSFADGVLSYIDLDLDVLVFSDFSYELQDADEFAVNSEQYGYPEDLKIEVNNAVAELVRLIDARKFPFGQ